jgi:very-short-patch-repair endonuclease
MAGEMSGSAPAEQFQRKVASWATRDGREATYLVKVLGAGAELRVHGTRDQKISMIAKAQRGRVSRRQLRAAGISDGVSSRLVARSMIFPLHAGVFAVGHLAPIELGAETAALLAVREGAALSHRSAALLWGMVRQAPEDGLIHVLVTGGSARSPAGVLVHRTRALTPRDVRIRAGLPVTAPAWTLLDLAGIENDRRLELAFDQALVSGIVRRPEIREVLARAGGRPGRGRLRELVADDGATAITRSEAEERFLELIRKAGLPQPEVNARICGYEVDFLWREQGLVVEIDGYRYHSTRRAFEHDRRKDAILQAAGLITTRITWRQLVREPLAVVARLARRLF